MMIYLVGTYWWTVFIFAAVITGIIVAAHFINKKRFAKMEASKRMFSLFCASVAEIVVGIVVAVIIVGGFGGYIGYKIWAKNTANAVAVATAELFGVRSMSVCEQTKR